MADMTTIKGRIQETIYPNGTGAITAESHQALLLEMVDNINEVKQDVLVSGQNIRPLISGESLLGGDALAVLGTRFIYELENQKLFAMIDGALQDLDPWMANRAVHSQVAQVIEIQKEGLFQELVPLTIKNKAGLAALCWEYDGMIYEASIEDDGLAVVSKPKGNQFDKEGNYPLLHVGTADDLAGRGESVPASFGFRASGGKSIKDGRAYIKAIKGNSVVWNQKYPDDWTFSMYGITSTSINGLVSIKGTAEQVITQFYQFTANELNHKYLFVLSGTSSQMEGKRFQLHNRKAYSVISGGYAYLFHENTDASKERYFGIAGITAGDVVSEHNIRVNQYDLTQMFGVGNEPTTIEEFNARVATLGVDMNAYNEGQVIHCNTESIKSVGDNAWDEEWENGTFNTTTGENINDPSRLNQVRSKSLIEILPNTQYTMRQPSLGTDGAWVMLFDKEKNIIKGYNGGTNVVVSGNSFKVPSLSPTFITAPNASYMRFYMPVGYGDTYNHDIMISLVHSGWKQDTDAGYQPYWQDTLPLPIIRKYFPQGMKSAGSAHDEIRLNKASGKWEYSKGKIKSVDLGTLNWKNLDASNGMFYLNAQEIAALNMAKSTNTEAPTNLMSSLYRSAPTFEITNIDKVFRGPFTTAYSGYLTVKDTSYTDAASFKAAMAGVILYYESNDWEWVELDAEDQNFRDYYQVADFGTEQAISTTPSAPFSADIIYQFNAVDMIREHEIEITELQSIIATMQAQLTALTNGGQ